MTTDPRPPLPDTLAREMERLRAELLRPTPNRAQRRGQTVRNIGQVRRPYGWEKR